MGEKPALSISFNPDDLLSGRYARAVAGSFDASYFTDPVTGKFTFPSYTKHWKGLVKIKDATYYKQDYFTGLSKKERAAFSLNDFERYFSDPDFEFETFDNFLERFPEENFNKGISKEEVLWLLEKFRHYLEYNLVEDHYILDTEETTEGLAMGLLTAVDISTDPKRYWSALHFNDLRATCQAYEIPPSAKRAVMIERLMAHGAEYPYAVVVPSPMLKEVYDSFVNLYLQDIRDNTNHFHPLYFQPLWKAVQNDCGNDVIRERIDALLAAPYWADRLYSYTPPEDENEDDDEH